MKKTLLICSLSALLMLLFLSSCSSAPTPEQVAEYMRPGVDKLEQMGILTAEQKDAVMGVIIDSVAVLYDKSAGWLEELLKQGATAITTLVAGYLGIRKWRGSPMKRTGIAPEATP